MTTTPTRAAIYARISNDPTGAGAGVTRQREDCHKLAVTLGWGVAGEYVDNDISAYSGKRRPEYERLLTDLAEARIDGVIVYHVDRLTRRPVELEHFINVLDAAGIRHVRFVTGDTDLSTGDGLLIARIMAAVAANESAAKSRRVARKHEQTAAEGRPHKGSVRPFGYESDFVTINQGEAAVLRRIVERFLAGESSRSIATWLAEEGVPTVRGSGWTTSTLKGMLTNPRYAGLRAHRGAVVGPATWEPIINADAYRRILARYAEIKTSGRRTPQRYLLSGMLRCGKCGNRLFSSSRNYRNSTTRRYVCLSGPDHGGCGRLTITAPGLEDLITEAVLYRLDGPELADALSGRGSTDAQTLDLSRELDAERQRLQDLAQAFGAGAITMQEWMTARKPIEQRLEATSRHLARLTKTTALVGLIGNSSALRDSWATLNLSRQVAIVAAVLDHAVIAPGQQGVHAVDIERVSPVWRV